MYGGDERCAQIHTQGAVTEPTLWIHRFKDNPDDDKSLFSFHPYLGTAQRLLATGKGGEPRV
jgi:hypothetical protein